MRYSSAAHTRFYHRFHVVSVTKYRYNGMRRFHPIDFALVC